MISILIVKTMLITTTTSASNDRLLRQNWLNEWSSAILEKLELDNNRNVWTQSTRAGCTGYVQKVSD